MVHHMSLSLLNCASHVSKLIELCTTDPFLRPYQLRLQTARLRVVRPASACAACSRAEPVIFSEAKNWTSGDRAVARVANTAGGAAAGRGFELCSTHDPHRGFSPYWPHSLVWTLAETGWKTLFRLNCCERKILFRLKKQVEQAEYGVSRTGP